MKSLPHKLARALAPLLALVIALACGCAGQDARVREAASSAIDALVAGDALPSNDYYPLLPDERLRDLAFAHEPLYKVCQTALGAISYELGDVTVEGDAAAVEVTVVAPDLYAALDRARQDVAAYALTEEAVREIAVREDVNQQARYLCDWLLVYLADHLGDEDVEQLTLTATAHLTRSDDGTWALDYSQNPELMAALFCVR